jgi:hypothetical protein
MSSGECKRHAIQLHGAFFLRSMHGFFSILAYSKLKEKE